MGSFLKGAIGSTETVDCCAVTCASQGGLSSSTWFLDFFTLGSTSGGTNDALFVAGSGAAETELAAVAAAFWSDDDKAAPRGEFCGRKASARSITISKPDFASTDNSRSLRPIRQIW